MSREDIVKTVLDLAKTSEEFENVKKEVYDLKQVKGQLENNVAILKRANKDEQEKFEKSKKDMDKVISELNDSITKLQEYRNRLATSVVPEIQHLENLKTSAAQDKTAIDAMTQSLSQREQLLSKGQKNLSEKIEVVKQIIKLSGQLYD